MEPVFNHIHASRKAEVLTGLRQKIIELECLSVNHAHSVLGFGIDNLDQTLHGGLAAAVTHECLIPNPEAQAATVGFLAALLGKHISGTVIWITQGMPLNPPGLRDFNLPPEKILIVQAWRDREALWAMEEALRMSGLGAVVAEIGTASLTATRRLQLAAEQGGVTGFLLRSRVSGPSCCVTRWRITPVPGIDDGLPGLGYPAWQIKLERMRGGMSGEWQIVWRDGRFALAPAAAAAPDYVGQKIAL